MSDLAILWNLAGVGLIALFCQWFSWRLRLPSILLLLLAGIIAGPVTGWLKPDELFGHLLAPFISLAVAVVLFEGSLTLRFPELGGLGKVVRNLITWGLLVEWLVIAVAVRWLVGFDWDLAVLFGAFTVVTGPTVILPLLRSVRPNRRVAEVLRWEGITIDPIGALLAVVVYQFVRSGYSLTLTTTLKTFFATLFWGAVMGAAAGYLFGLVLRRRFLPAYLQEIAALFLVFAVYTLANTVERESGLLAVTVMGLWLANMPRVPTREILSFKESLSVLLISILFIILAARVDFTVFEKLAPWQWVAVFATVQFLSRPLKIFLSTLGSHLSFRERLLVAFIGPRGIVAAAVTALFALRLEQHGYAGADLMVPLSFSVIIGTVLFSALARPLARWLGLVEGGVLIAGANRVARSIAKKLRELGVHVLLSDTSWREVEEARRQGLPTYYGSLLSERAEHDIDPVRFEGMLFLSPYAEQNVLAVLKYHDDLGSENLYLLASENARHIDPKMAFIGRLLFGEGITYELLDDWLRRGAEIKAIPLSKGLGWKASLRQYGDRVLVLCARKPNGEVVWATAERKLRPRKRWTVVVLLKPSGAE